MAAVERLCALSDRGESKREHVRALDDSVIRDRYQFTHELGKGTFGVVHLAIRRSDSTPWAVKEVPRRDPDDVQWQRRIDREVQILKTITHPFIISMVAVYETRSRFFLVLQFCDLDTLDSCMRKREFTEAEIRAITWQIGLALAHLHRNCIVHRDLKPSNVLCTTVKPNLADFDTPLAHLLDETPFYVKLTDFSVSIVKEIDAMLMEVCGTLSYMAPEVVDETKMYSQQCDIWSLGIILYEMIAGKLPFVGPDNSTICNLILRAAYDVSTPRFRRVSSSCVVCLQALLQADPARRITAHELLYHPWFRARKTSIETTAHRKDTRSRPPPDVRTERRGTLPNVLDLMKAFREELVTKERDDRDDGESGRSNNAPARQLAPKRVEPRPKSDGLADGAVRNPPTVSTRRNTMSKVTKVKS